MGNGDTRVIAYKFTAKDEVTPVSERVRRALRGLKESAEKSGLAGESSILNLARGKGTLEIVSAISEQLKELPETVHKYKEALRYGATKAEASAKALSDFIPVVGNLAQGFRIALDMATGQYAEEEKRQEKELDQKLSKEREARTKARRDAFAIPEFARNRQALNEINLGTQEGLTRQATEAKQKMDDALEDIKNRRALVGGMAEVDQPGLYKGLDDQAEAAKLAYQRTLDDIKRQRLDSARDVNAQLRDLNLTALTKEMSDLGESYDAKIELRRNALAREIEVIQKAQEDMERRGVKIEASIQREMIDASTRSAIFDLKGILKQQEQAIADLGIGALGGEDGRRLSIALNASRQKQQLVSLLAGQNMSAEERAVLEAASAALPGQTNAALAALDRGRYYGTAPGEESSRLTGLAASAREDPAAEVQANTAELVKLQAATNALIRRLIDKSGLNLVAK